MKRLYRIRFYDGTENDVVDYNGEEWVLGERDMWPLSSFSKEDYVKIKEAK